MARVFSYQRNKLIKFSGVKKSLEERRNQNQTDPLFTYLSFQSAQQPMQAPFEYQELYSNGIKSTQCIISDSQVVNVVLKRPIDPIGSHITDKKRRNYAACVTAMDDAIGKIIDLYKGNYSKFNRFHIIYSDFLNIQKATGIWNNTIVIFSSDNGGSNNAGGYNWPLRGEKGTLWEGGVKSPGFIHSPLIARDRIGSVSNSLMHVTDWFPTILDFGQCSRTDTERPLDGISQAHVIDSQSEEEQYSAREEILHQLNPLAYIPDEIKDPRGDWKNDHDGPLNGRCFGIGVRAAIRTVFIHPKSPRMFTSVRIGQKILTFKNRKKRFRNWKLQTGIGSIKDELESKSGWVEAPSDTKIAVNLFEVDFSEEKAFGQWCTDDECEDRQGIRDFELHSLESQ